MAQSILKRFLGLVLALIAYQSGFAKCSMSGIAVVGESRSLAKNGMVIVEFYAYSQQHVAGIGNKYLVYLRSKTATVLMQPVEILKGEMEVTEVVFRPTCDLVVSDIYELHIDSLPERFQSYNIEKRAFEPYTFTITGIGFTTLPAFGKLPVEVNRTMDVFGCGPARFVHFAITGDENIKFVRANVKAYLGNSQTSYILPVQNGKVLIGHGMCSGAFHFNGRDFTVQFSPIDAAGNEGSLSNTISFKRPEIEDGGSERP